MATRSTSITGLPRVPERTLLWALLNAYQRHTPLRSLFLAFFMVYSLSFYFGTSSVTVIKYLARINSRKGLLLVHCLRVQSNTGRKAWWPKQEVACHKASTAKDTERQREAGAGTQLALVVMMMVEVLVLVV